MLARREHGTWHSAPGRLIQTLDSKPAQLQNSRVGLVEDFADDSLSVLSVANLLRLFAACRWLLSPWHA